MQTLLHKLRILVRLIRIYQWTKNGLVLMPLVFAQELLNASAVLKSIRATLAFCLAAGATYIFNDLRDLEKDRNHPDKCRRPLPAGEVSKAGAGIVAVLLLAGSIGLAAPLPPPFWGALLAYVGLTSLYTLVLKRIFILDVIIVATGFVIRAIAGAVAIDVVFSNWLVVCTFFLALFLALGKRRGEIVVLNNHVEGHRDVLLRYNTAFIDQLLLVVASGALITFTIYTCSPDVIERMGTDKLYMTLPFVVYGLARYLWLVQQNRAEDPSRTLLKDRPLLAAVALWALASAGILYL